MKLSKYTHWIEILDGEYAVFNSILMQIVFVNSKQLENIKKFKVTKEEKSKLLDLGIYVKNNEIIDEIYIKLSNSIKKQSKQLSIMYLNISTY